MPSNKTIIVKPTKKQPRRATVVADMYPDLYTGRQMPISIEFFERLACEYTTWATDDKDALKPIQFAFKKRIPRTSFQRFCQTKEPMINAHDNVKALIAMRREFGMMKGLYKEKSTMHMQHHYDDEWKEADLYHADLHAKSSGDGQEDTIIVIDKLKEQEE